MLAKFLTLFLSTLLIFSATYGTNYRIGHKSTLDKWKEELIYEALKARQKAYAALQNLFKYNQI